MKGEEVKGEGGKGKGRGKERKGLKHCYSITLAYLVTVSPLQVHVSERGHGLKYRLPIICRQFVIASLRPRNGIPVRSGLPSPLDRKQVLFVSCLIPVLHNLNLFMMDCCCCRFLALKFHRSMFRMTHFKCSYCVCCVK